ncbi:acetyl-CoA synthetase-like protein [Lepidopterella palustris CBS 459.81]|uniref:Acetyl-CoA synthetase-like protein n=1 Tax=Lepidopterella palustris CBS 459.81 TaxID=1314670 RepID=A0A8E2JCH8_9PEZI|nr:acetyl-CoA synthetase-like protein [Lepidopterella palustris CBS 459.81]
MAFPDAKPPSGESHTSFNGQSEPTSKVFCSLPVHTGSTWDVAKSTSFQNLDDLAIAKVAWSVMLHILTDSLEVCFPSIGLDNQLSLIKVRRLQDWRLPDHFEQPLIRDHTSIKSLWRQVPFRNHQVINTLVLQRFESMEFQQSITSALHVDVLLEVVKQGSECHFNIRYVKNVLTPNNAKTISGIFRYALEILQTLSGPRVTIERIDLAEDSAAACQKKVARCIHDLIEEQVLVQPSSPAIEAHDGHYTFEELSVASFKLSDLLVRLGARPDARAAILMEKSSLYPVSVLAVLKAGAAFVPLDPSHPMQRLQQLVQDVQPFVIISSTSLSRKAHELGKHVLLADSIQAESLEQPLPAIQSLANPSNAAYIIFTSGSTGKPKGVIIEHAAIATSAILRGRATGLGVGSRVLQYATHVFDVSVDEILTTLVHGGCVCVPSEAERFGVAPAMERMKINHALLTPTSARMLDPDDVPSLRTLQLGGELLSEDVNKKWSNRVRLFNVYGPTEASVAAVMSERTGQKGPGHVIGKAVGTVCYVVNPEDHNQLLPPNTVGELVIGGHTLARGYLNDAEKTDMAFFKSPPWMSHTGFDCPGRFYKTGDLASMDSNGTMTIHGRKDNQVKIRGQRINVEEIEDTLVSRAHAHGAIVALPKSGPLKNKLTAIVPEDVASHHAADSISSHSCFSNAKDLDAAHQARLDHDLRTALPSTMIPSKWISLPFLPQNSSSKTDRKQIQTWLEDMSDAAFHTIFQHGIQAHAESATTLSNLEARVRDIWCQVLNLSPSHLRPDKSFIRNGGDSITAIELRRLAKNAGISFKISDILSAGSVRELLGCSTATTEKHALHLEDEAGGPFPLSPIQRFYFENKSDGTDGFTQSVCVKVKDRVTKETLRSAIRALVSRHSMLRARFLRIKEDWMQVVADDVGETYSMSTYVLQQSEDLRSFVKSQVPEFSLTAGPVFNATYIEWGVDTQVLRLSAHHLVVDFVSWRILLQDLENLIRGNKPSAATMSFRAWCGLQAEFVKTLDPKAACLIRTNPDNHAFWIPKNGPLLNSYGTATKSEFKLSASDSKALMGQCNETLGTQPTEIMLATFYTAFSRIFIDRETPNVFIESHGREPWDACIDISRTVGWFTTAYPLAVPATLANNISSAIEHTKQRRRTIHDNGHSYWCCRYLTKHGRLSFDRNQPMEFVFNFAGQYQQFDREDSIFRLISGVGEETAHPEAHRFSLFDILITMEAGHLHFNITFPGNVNHRDRVDKFFRAWKTSLKTVAREYSTLQISFSSLPNYPVDLRESLKCSNIDLHKDVEDIYCTSGLQEHMLHSQATNPSHYKVVGTWKLQDPSMKSSLDLKCLRNAWNQVVNNHANLRTTFFHNAMSNRFIGVVLKRVKPIIVLTAEKHLCSLGTVRWSSFNNQEIRYLPHRMVIVKMNDGSVGCRLEFSHAIIDATSRDILLKELVDAYSGRIIPPDRSFYQQYLAQVTPSVPARVSAKIPRCIFPTNLWHKGIAETISLMTVPSLSADVNPFETCQQSGVTISSIIFTAWSLILSKYTFSTQISFAYVALNRPTNVSGIERAVGCYIKLLVCSVELSSHDRVWDIARHIQRHCANCMSGDIQAEEATEHPENGRDSGVLNTMVNVRNTGASSSDFQSERLAMSLRSFEDPWAYDFVLSVDKFKAQPLQLTLQYCNTKISQAVATRVVQDLNMTLNSLFMDSHLTKHAWDLLLEPDRPREVIGL